MGYSMEVVSNFSDYDIGEEKVQQTETGGRCSSKGARESRTAEADENSV